MKGVVHEKQTEHLIKRSSQNCTTCLGGTRFFFFNMLKQLFLYIKKKYARRVQKSSQLETHVTKTFTTGMFTF